MGKPFQFEADAAPFPILAAHWEGKEPAQAAVSYQNKQFTKLFGEREGTRLIELFDNLLGSDGRSTSGGGKALLEKIVENRHVHGIQGNLGGKRVELYAEMQDHDPSTIQCTVLNHTDRYMDFLTGIPGRELFFDRLNIALFRSYREEEKTYLCFLDLDDFKQINDEYGHQVADAVLCDVAQRLSLIVRRHETVARLAGDEFTLVLSGMDIDIEQFVKHRVIPVINTPYTIGDVTIDYVGVSIGIACFPDDATDADKLVSYADDAMYVAKAEGKNRVVLYSPNMHQGKVAQA